MVETLLTALENRYEAASSAVAVALGTDPAYTRISPEEATPLLRNCAVIWRRQLLINEQWRTVEVGLPPYFPDEPPVAFVLEWQDLVLRNPHVLNGGLLCIIPESASIDSDDPAGLLTYVFQGAEVLLNGTTAEDFRDEFAYYWNLRAGAKSRDVVVITPPGGLGTTFPVASSEGVAFVASSIEELNRWLCNARGKAANFQQNELGIAVHLDRPLSSSEYPDSLADLISLAEANDAAAARILKAHITKDFGGGLVLLQQKDGNGVALGGVTFTGLGLSRLRTRELMCGFRPGRVPQGLLLKRSAARLTSTKIERNHVMRVDHEHIHTRGGDGKDLSQKSVLVMGGGSLGGYVCHLLSRAGVGRITIIDKERLAWENLGRHILGSAYMGQWKAEGLAEELTRQMPHLEINGIPEDWRQSLTTDPNLFSKYDLVLSTVANWRCEAPLNTLSRQPQMPIVAFGWLEPYAVAGHCLVIGPEGGCFQCAANSFGQFTQNASTFTQSTLSKDPGGCTHYQQYSPIALLQVAALISSTIVEKLDSESNRSSLNTWIGSEEHWQTVGANLSDGWAPRVHCEGYSRIYQKPWEKAQSCTICSQTNL